MENLQHVHVEGELDGSVEVGTDDGFELDSTLDRGTPENCMKYKINIYCCCMHINFTKIQFSSPIPDDDCALLVDAEECDIELEGAAAVE